MNKLICFMIFLTGVGYTMEFDLPTNLKRLGLANPKDFTACRTLNHPHPILSYQLDKGSIEEMEVQHQVALNAKKENRNTIALKILWDLAERGYAPANDELSDAFLHGSLGLTKNPRLMRIFLDRPYTIEDMIKTQNSVLYHWENRQMIREEIKLACISLDAACRKNEVLKVKAADTTSHATTRDSGSSIDSFHLDDTEEAHYNPLLVAHPTSTSHFEQKKKK